MTASYRRRAHSSTGKPVEFCLRPLKINIGESGNDEVLVHFPVAESATSHALYEVFISDYIDAPVGDTVIGTPVLTVTVNQADESAYTTAADDDGFISIGSVEINVVPPEVVTTVIRLSPAENDESTRGGPSPILVSDAVGLVKNESPQ